MLEEQGTPVEGVRALFVMNQENGGFDRPGCAWPDDPSGLHLDICENGVKHVTWELTRKQAGRDFFAAHTVSELAGWTDYDLEAAGRLAEPVTTTRTLTGTCRSRGRLRSTQLAARCAVCPARTRPRSTPPGGSATRRRSCTSCKCASSAPTTCPTARTCATRPAGGT